MFDWFFLDFFKKSKNIKTMREIVKNYKITRNWPNLMTLKNVKKYTKILQNMHFKMFHLLLIFSRSALQICFWKILGRLKLEENFQIWLQNFMGNLISPPSLISRERMATVTGKEGYCNLGSDLVASETVELLFWFRPVQWRRL